MITLFFPNSDKNIDYISDHAESIELIAKFVSGYGWLGIVKIDEKEKYRTGKFYSSMNEAMEKVVNFINKNMPGEML